MTSEENDTFFAGWNSSLPEGVTQNSHCRSQHSWHRRIPEADATPSFLQCDMLHLCTERSRRYCWACRAQSDAEP